MGVVAALAPKNCDNFFDLSQRADGVYEIFVGRRIIQTFCEFDRNGYNWIVRWLENIFDLERTRYFKQ